MKVITLIVGELQTNCYLAISEETNKCLIIDPGDEANYISEKVLQQNLKPVAIVATHGHYDHVLAANELQMAFKIPFLIHKKDEEILKYMNQSAKWWLKRKIIEKSPKINKFLKENEKISLGKEALIVLHSPGHSPGGICLYNKKNKIIFSGDTLFKDGIGRTDFSYGSPNALEQSLKKLYSKFSGFRLYPGHGKPSYL